MGLWQRSASEQVGSLGLWIYSSTHLMLLTGARQPSEGQKGNVHEVSCQRTLKCFDGQTYLPLLCGWILRVPVGLASPLPYQLHSPPLTGQLPVWSPCLALAEISAALHCDGNREFCPSGLSPTWHKLALLFVIVGVAMATACRYKPCPGDIVKGE